jgi:hypothetical protein
MQTAKSAFPSIKGQAVLNELCDQTVGAKFLRAEGSRKEATIVHYTF